MKEKERNIRFIKELNGILSNIRKKQNELFLQIKIYESECRNEKIKKILEK